MPKRASAPRRKKDASAAKQELRGTKLTCTRRVCNAEKWSLLEPLFGRVCALKNKMSAFVHQNALAVLCDPYGLKSWYKHFTSTDLNAWERQALFHDIVGDYQRSLSQRLKAHPFRLQGDLSFQTYQRAVTRRQVDGSTVALAVAGQIKEGSLELRQRKTVLTALANYLLRVNIALFDPAALAEDHKLKADFLRVASDPLKWDWLKRVARLRQVRLIARQSLVHYVTGTFRVSPKESRTAIVEDTSNSHYKYWLKLRVGVGAQAEFHHFPLLFNQGRLGKIAQGDITNLGFGTELRLKLTSGKKLHICTVYEAPELAFAPEGEALGLDLNTKRNFATDNRGRSYHLDELVMAQGLKLLDAIDRAGGVSHMHYRHAAQLRQWLRRNEAHIQRRLAAWCNEWARAGITDLWLEDLSMSHDTTFIRHPALGEKYSRVLRLMRLSAAKDWLSSIAEKRGLRVHTTNPAYSSQMCPACGHISRQNRPSQEHFECVACGHTADADHVAAQNIKHRGKQPLRDALHESDAHGRCSPKRMRRGVLKNILGQHALAGGVTELPTPASSNKLGRIKRSGSSGSPTHSA